MKVSELLIFVGNRHALEVAIVSDGLKVAANQQKVNFVVVPSFQRFNMAIYCIKLSMTAALYGDL